MPPLLRHLGNTSQSPPEAAAQPQPSLANARHLVVLLIARQNRREPSVASIVLLDPRDAGNLQLLPGSQGPPRHQLGDKPWAKRELFLRSHDLERR